MRHNNAKKLTFAQDSVSPLGMRKAEALALSEEEFAFSEKLPTVLRTNAPFLDLLSVIIL